MSIKRRDFLIGGTAAGALVGGGVLVPIGLVLTDDDTGATSARLATFNRVRVAGVGELTDNPIFFDYPWEGATNIIVAAEEAVPGGVGPDSNIVAFSNLCTHMGCPITEYSAEDHVLGPCPCHFSTFDLSRNGVASFGQATQNLPRVLLEVDGDDIFATGVFRLIYGFGENLEGEQLVEVRS